MSNFNWNSIDESAFQGHLNKYTNAFKGYQTRYFVLDAQTKNLFYFMSDEVRKKGPRGVIELPDCWISPSNEDDITFTIQTGSGDIFKLRANDAKERQKWIDKLRTCSGANAANIYVSTLPISKTHQTNSSSLANSPNETHMRSLNRQKSNLHHHQQPINELKEVIRCVKVNQREFVETIDTIPDDIPLHSLSKEMLLLRSMSQSCISSLEDSLIILTRRRTPDNESIPISAPSTPSPQSSIAIINTSNKPSSQSLNNSTNGRSSLTVGLSSQSNLFNSSNRTLSFGGFKQHNGTVLSTKNLRTDVGSFNRLSESSQ
jgi:hypothetical protein